MKNKYYLYGLFAAALTLTGCDYNEDHFPGYDELAQPKDVWNDTITLADADYKTIAGIEANKELALSKDPEGETFKAALEACRMVSACIHCQQVSLYGRQFQGDGSL